MNIKSRLSFSLPRIRFHVRCAASMPHGERRVVAAVPAAFRILRASEMGGAANPPPPYFINPLIKFRLLPHNALYVRCKRLGVQLSWLVYCCSDAFGWAAPSSLGQDASTESGRAVVLIRLGQRSVSHGEVLLLQVCCEYMPDMHHCRWRRGWSCGEGSSISRG